MTRAQPAVMEWTQKKYGEKEGELFAFKERTYKLSSISKEILTTKTCKCYKADFNGA